MAQFRFLDMEIWKMSVEIADDSFDIANEVEMKRNYGSIGPALFEYFKQYCRRLRFDSQKRFCPIFNFCQTLRF